VVRDPQKFLPLRPVEFQILVSLSRGPSHGYAIIQDAEDRGEEGAIPGMATLYRALTRMETEGLLERVHSDADPEGGDRRRPYRMTDLGASVARAEAARLARLVKEARRSRLLEATDEG